MTPHEDERVRAYIDGELPPEDLQALLADARLHPELRRELDRQLALRRYLGGIEPPSPSLTRVEPRRAPWVRHAWAFCAALGVALAWGSSGTSRLPPQRTAASELIPVHFSYRGDATSVSVAGSFTHWAREGIPMRAVAPGLWEAVVALPRGEHRYLFNVNGELRADPAATHFVADGSGAVDALLII